MGIDKVSHFCVGMSIVAILYPFGILPAAAATMIAAVGKEVWDSYGNGTPDVMDAVATIVGGASLLTWYQYII